MKQTLVMLIVLLVFQPAFSHFKARYHVVVDTDGGVDDFRALCMMLASPEIEIMAITVVDGVLTPEETAGKVRSLLQHFGHEGIPVGLGVENEHKPVGKAGTCGLASRMQWGTSQWQPPSVVLPEAVDLLLKSVRLEDMPVDIVAMGPLTNISSALKQHPSLAGEVRALYWYGQEMPGNGLNNLYDPDAARMVMESAFQMDMIDAGGSTLGKKELFMAGLDTLTTSYAKAVKVMYHIFSQELKELPMMTRLGDDCLPLFMLYPEYFSWNSNDEESGKRVVVAQPAETFAPPMLEILDSDQEDKSIIFSRFPVDTGLFEADVAAIAHEVIEKHGLKEWKIVVLTNEFHEHMGIYSILGAKMGLRAREYYHLGIDELSIVTFAGSQPPCSCLNDGLQVSTGSTMGHGTIMLGEGGVFPGARFSFKDRQIELEIREDIREQIKSDVRHGVQTYGLESVEYWTYIRELALKYWLELSRFDIFTINQIPIS